MGYIFVCSLYKAILRAPCVSCEFLFNRQTKRAGSFGYRSVVSRFHRLKYWSDAYTRSVRWSLTFPYIFLTRETVNFLFRRDRDPFWSVLIRFGRARLFDPRKITGNTTSEGSHRVYSVQIFILPGKMENRQKESEKIRRFSISSLKHAFPVDGFVCCLLYVKKGRIDLVIGLRRREHRRRSLRFIEMELWSKD